MSDKPVSAALPTVPMALADFNSVMDGFIKPGDMPMDSLLLIQRLLDEHYSSKLGPRDEAIRDMAHTLEKIRTWNIDIYSMRRAAEQCLTKHAAQIKQAEGE